MRAPRSGRLESRRAKGTCRGSHHWCCWSTGGRSGEEGPATAEARGRLLCPVQQQGPFEGRIEATLLVLPLAPQVPGPCSATPVLYSQGAVACVQYKTGSRSQGQVRKRSSARKKTQERQQAVPPRSPVFDHPAPLCVTAALRRLAPTAAQLRTPAAAPSAPAAAQRPGRRRRPPPLAARRRCRR